MADRQYGERKCEKRGQSFETGIRRVFGVTDYQFQVKIYKIINGGSNMSSANIKNEIT